MPSTSDKEAKSSWQRLLAWYSEEDISEAQVAYSGGKDSTLVLDSAREALDDIKAIIIDAEVYPDREVKEAIERVKTLGVPFEVKKTSKLKEQEFCSNTDKRCYHCKLQLFASMDDDKTILEGTNATEVEGHRPGLEAVEEHARAPLLETGIDEEEVRAILKWRGFKVWDKPSFACLASRFPSGRELTEEKLKRIEKIEDQIFNLDVDQLRVRDLGDTARIEVWPEDVDKIIDNRERIVEWCKEEGYSYVSLDLEGYRTGSISGS